jgi:hypothetical protein
LSYKFGNMNPVWRVLLLYAPFLVLDIISCALNVRRTLRSRGASGLPLVPLILYMLMLVRLPGVDIESKALAALLASLIHFTLVFAVRHLYRSLA